jgi:hypothetical protein
VQLEGLGRLIKIIIYGKFFIKKVFIYDTVDSDELNIIEER